MVEKLRKGRPVSVVLLSLVGALHMILAVCQAGAQPLEQISGVEIVGGRRIDEWAIKAQLKHLSGTITREQLSEELKSIYRTGFFANVTAKVVTTPQGRRILRYEVLEKPVVRRVFIKGNKELKDTDLSTPLSFDTRKFYDAARANTLVRGALSVYQLKGFYDAQITPTATTVGENEVDVTFSIQEGRRYSIRRVSFRGVASIDPDELRSTIETKRYKWWNSWLLGTGRLNQEMLENDKTLLRQYLIDHGFLEGAVSEPVIERGNGTIDIVFEVSEGPVYQVGSIAVEGDLVENSQVKTLEGIETESGEVFNASRVRKDAFTISDKFADVGYAFANVVPDTKLNREARSVDLDFKVSKGNSVTINRIEIQGNQKTYDNVIRRELTIQEQDQFSASKIRRSQELLQRLGYFEEANISTNPGDDPSKVDLSVNVREGSTGSFSAGAGFSSADGALFNTRLSEANLFGTGRRLDLNLDFGTERNNFILSLDDRRVADSRLSLGADLLLTERQFVDFDRTLTGGGMTAGYPLEELLGERWRDFNAYLKYEYLLVDISNVDDSAAQLIRDSEGNSTASALTPRLVRNTINNPLNPTRGSRQSLSFEYAGLGGDQEYYLFEFRHQSYTPLIKSSNGDLVFAYRTNLDIGDTYGDTDSFPLFKRFFPGGVNSVRGYKSRRLGPRDENGQQYGGASEFVNNFELIFPLVNSAGLRGVVFYDLGEAFDDGESIKIDQLRKAYGFGVRWQSPLGPIRLEFGFPVGARDDESDGMVTMFAFGAPV